MFSALSLVTAMLMLVCVLSVIASQPASGLALTSLAISVSTLLLAFLIIPVLVLPPLGFFFGLKSFRRFRAAHPDARMQNRVLAAVPMVFSVGMLVFASNLINSGYRA